LSWDATVPAATSLQVYVKTADTAADLNTAAARRFGPFSTSPVDLAANSVPKSKFLRVEFVLVSRDGKSTPVLKSFDLRWKCTISIN
jgi:hypothetical protein